MTDCTLRDVGVRFSNGMKIALVSDIHANRPAWNATMRDIESQGVELILCLGDIVGYGPSPLAVLDSVRKHCPNIVIGNHDAVIAQRCDPELFHDEARQIIDWTARKLDAEATRFLQLLPDELLGDHYLVTHAEAVDPCRFWYVDTPEEARENFSAFEQSLLFIGHTHHPGFFELNTSTHRIQWAEPTDFTISPGNRYIVNTGSVGDPRGHDLRATYCVYDETSGKIQFRKVPFSLKEYAEDFRKNGLHILPHCLTGDDDPTPDKPSSGDTGENPPNAASSPPREAEISKCQEPRNAPTGPQKGTSRTTPRLTLSRKTGVRRANSTGKH